jgi:hypothetical protein
MDLGDGYAQWKLLYNALSMEEICQVIRQHDGHCFLDVMMAPVLEQHPEIVEQIAGGDERSMSLRVETVEATTDLVPAELDEMAPRVTPLIVDTLRLRPCTLLSETQCVASFRRPLLAMLKLA